MSIYQAHEDEFQLAQKYAPIVKAVIYGNPKFALIRPYVIHGILSRESLHGLALQPPGPTGTGDHTPRKGKLPPDGLGWGRGLMQIDYFWHPDWCAQKDDEGGLFLWQIPKHNIAKGCEILSQSISYVMVKNQKRSLDTRIDQETILRMAIAGYNCGASGAWISYIESGNPDTRTAHGNYSVDVLDRAEFYRDKQFI